MKSMILSIPLKLRRRFAALMVSVCAMVMMAVPALASGEAAGFVLTEDDLNPLLNSITANVKVIFPVILIVTGIFIVIALAPRLFQKATHPS